MNQDYIRILKIRPKGQAAWCFELPGNAADIIADSDGDWPWEVVPHTMLKSDFDNLPEFSGW